MTARVYVNRLAEFEASHWLGGAGLSDEENARLYGKEALPHGHNWTIRARVGGPVRRRDGMIVSLEELKAALRREAEAELDHKCLNLDAPAFREVPPTPENVALFVWGRLERAARRFRLDRVEVRETERSGARCSGTYDEETRMPLVTLIRTYEFTATHRLRHPKLSDEENARLYGKCSSPNGHGHDYRLELSVETPIDEALGAAPNRLAIDEIAQKEAVERFDYRHINDMEEFREVVPTSENVVRFLYETLKPLLEAEGLRLKRARLYETRKSWFDCEE